MEQTLINYWSYSSMLSFLSNPMAFKKQYILKQYDDMMSPSGLVGTAAHKALETYFKGMTMDNAILEGQRIIDKTSDMSVNWGKTGSRAAVVKAYNQAINFYFAEMPKFHEILAIEEPMVEPIQSMIGGDLSIPAKAKLDIIERNIKGEIVIHDHKFVSSYSDGNTDDPKHFLQGMFAYYVVKAKYGEAPARISFDECKIAKNKDGSLQLQPYVYEYGSPADFALFEKFYNDCTRQLQNPDLLFLPNITDMFNGPEMFEIYRQAIMDVEAPISVPHKTQQVDYVERNYVASAADQVDNTNLSVEEKVRTKLQEFNIPVEMRETFVGPSITKYTLKPSRGIPMSKIAKMTDDIAIALKAKSVRIEAPMRGTDLVGVEVPSEHRKTIELAENHLHKGTLDIPIGVNVFGETIYRNLSDMPHLLIAGQTGSGKSVMINVLLKSLSEQMDAKDFEMVLIDPKRVELAPFNDLPHMIFPVIYELEDAYAALDLMVELMEERYNILATQRCRNIDEYNKSGKRMSRVMLLIDEFADLMMNGGTEERVKKVIDGYGPRGGELSHIEKSPSLETQIVRIAQKARAVGIHLVLATQRPSADVVTPLIKANVPTKIAFSTTTRTNSQVILDTPGAEELTGKGDMLFQDPVSGIERLQGLYA